jgi:hypothetical protein
MGGACYKIQEKTKYVPVDCDDAIAPPLVSITKHFTDRLLVGGWEAPPSVEVVRELSPENDYACWNTGSTLTCSQVLGWRVFECMIASTETGDCEEIRKMVSALYLPSNFLVLPSEADIRFRKAEESLCTAIDSYDDIRRSTVLSHKWSTRVGQMSQPQTFKITDAVYVSVTILKHYPNLEPLRTATDNTLIWKSTIDHWLRIIEFLSRLD